MVRIIVADDDKDSTNTTVQALIDEGYDAIGVYDWTGLLSTVHRDVLRHQPPAFILLDLHFKSNVGDSGEPPPQGTHLLEMLHKNPKYRGIPIVILTGLLDPQDKARQDRCRRHGAVDYLHKPVDLELLLETIERVVRG